MASIEVFSELLRALYSAPLEQDQWPKFLTLLSKHTSSHNALLLSADTSFGLSVVAQGHETQDAHAITAYNEQYARSDPFRSALVRCSRTRNPIGVFTDEDLLPNQGLLNTDLYRNVLVDATFRYGTFTILAFSVRCVDAISVWRTHEEGPMDTGGRDLLTLLIPHVQTALNIRRY